MLTTVTPKPTLCEGLSDGDIGIGGHSPSLEVNRVRNFFDLQKQGVRPA